MAEEKSLFRLTLQNEQKQEIFRTFRKFTDLNEATAFLDTKKADFDNAVISEVKPAKNYQIVVNNRAETIFSDRISCVSMEEATEYLNNRIERLKENSDTPLTGNVSEWRSREEKKEYAASRDILSVAGSLGIEIKQEGRVLKNADHKSMEFYPKTNSFSWYSQEIAGNPITLVMTMTDKSFTEAIEYLNTENLIESEILNQEVVRTPFKYYLKDKEDFSLARDYLVNERKIDPKIVDKLHSEGLLVQSEYRPPDLDELHPCLVAKWQKDGKVVGGSIQGLVHDVASFGKRGKDKRIMFKPLPNYGWSYTIGEPKKVVFAESFTDLFSYWSMNPDLNNCMLVDMEGLKENTIKNFLVEIQEEHKSTLEDGVVMAVDNDVAAQRLVDKLADYRFARRENYVLAQPDNNAVLKEYADIYELIGQKHGVDPLAIAAMHKSYVNAENCNELANPWHNDQFFGKDLRPSKGSKGEKPSPINVYAECEKAAKALVMCQKGYDEYDFAKMTNSQTDLKKKPELMAAKLYRVYAMYKTEGLIPKNEIIKDQNDLLKSLQTEPASLKRITEDFKLLPTQGLNISYWKGVFQVPGLESFELIQSKYARMSLETSPNDPSKWQFTDYMKDEIVQQRSYSKADIEALSFQEFEPLIRRHLLTADNPKLTVTRLVEPVEEQSAEKSAENQFSVEAVKKKSTTIETTKKTEAHKATIGSER